MSTEVYIVVGVSLETGLRKNLYVFEHKSDANREIDQLKAFYTGKVSGYDYYEIERRDVLWPQFM